MSYVVEATARAAAANVHVAPLYFEASISLSNARANVWALSLNETGTRPTQDDCPVVGHHAARTDALDGGRAPVARILLLPLMADTDGVAKAGLQMNVVASNSGYPL